MPNPLNPLEWLRSAQDWFTKTERSSGFRPYLVFAVLAYGLGVVLLASFAHIPEIRGLASWIMGGVTAGFMALFAVKAFQDPDFCRSETHIQKMTKMELEARGTESELFDAEVVDAELIQSARPETEVQRLPAEVRESE